MATGEGSDFQHLKSDEYKDAHKAIKEAYENGACLNGRCQGFYEAVTCCYRYQGIEAARGHLGIYNSIDVADIYHLQDEKGAIRTRVFAALSKKDVRREIAINGKYTVLEDARVYRRDPPVGKTTGEVFKRFKDDKAVYKKNFWFVNFTVGSVPWPNQVHHVLNHSSLNKVIASFTNIPQVVNIGLLQEIYNINHKVNAVILPTNEKWTRITGLPTHGSHPAYSKRVKGDIEKAMAGYEQLDADAAKPDHPKPDPLKVKDELIKISDKWYKKILDVVPVNKAKKETAAVIKVNGIT